MQFFVIDWLKFLPALVLLLTPGDIFYRAEKIRHRSLSRDWSDHWLRALAHGMHTIDLARAALGTWLLIDSLQTLPEARGAAKYAALFTQGVIRIGAVWLQTAVCRRPDSANAPFAFVIGLLLGGVSPLVAAFAVALAVPIAMGTSYPSVFFPVLGLAHLGIGFWFKGKGALVSLAFGAMAAMVPWFWSLMFNRDLVVAHRARRKPEGHQQDELR